MTLPVPSTVTKRYLPRGPVQLFRFAESSAFVCLRCGQTKTSKIMAIYDGDWTRRLCNACYGRLLSLYEVKARTDPEDQRAEALATLLLAAVDEAQRREAERLLRTADMQTQHLTPEAVRFLATAEYVAGHLGDAPDLEWSPAVIGLCKAFELELVAHVLAPLASAVTTLDLSADRADKDLGRVAGYCAQPEGKPPELGAVGHFLRTAIHSTERRERSPLLRALLTVAKRWSGSGWLLDPRGCVDAISVVTTRFRNPAAHTTELGRADYLACRQHIIGPGGALWRLVLATQGR